MFQSTPLFIFVFVLRGLNSDRGLRFYHIHCTIFKFAVLSNRVKRMKILLTGFYIKLH